MQKSNSNQDTMTQDIIPTQHGEETGLSLSDTNVNFTPISQEEYELNRAALEALEKADVKNAPQITSQYWEARKGDSIRGFFRGWQVLKKDAPQEPEGVKLIPAIVVETLNGIYLNGSMQVIDTFKHIPMNKAVYLECTHDKSGEMKRFDIKLLD